MADVIQTLAIIQARMNSSRLPGKVLADIGGRTLLSLLVERVRACKAIDLIVIATTNEPSDNVIVDWAENNDIKVFRGSTNDVLDRFYSCAKRYLPNYVVRITADDPFKDPQIISYAIKICIDNNADYVSNTLIPSYPEGLDVEVIKFAALERAAKCAMLSSEREHVTPYIWKNIDKFKSINFKMSPNLSRWRWTVDKQSDLDFVRTVFSHFSNDSLVRYQDIIEWLNFNSQIVSINSGTIRNEGYLNSIKDELL